MHFDPLALFEDPAYQPVISAYRTDETASVRALLEHAGLAAKATEQIADRARTLVEAVRAEAGRAGGIDAFMHEYELSSQQGVVLMCLAEALLRIPDTETVDRLVEDKIGASDWESHLGASEALFVNASTWALMLTGRILRPRYNPERTFTTVLHRLVRRSGEPVIRQANTDVSYLACARKLLADPKHFYPQFATRNAHTVAYLLEVAAPETPFEFQRLHGMAAAEARH